MATAQKAIWFPILHPGNRWHGSAKGFQLTPIGFKTLTKRPAESRISLADGLKLHSNSPRSKSAASRSRVRSTLA